MFTFFKKNQFKQKDLTLLIAIGGLYSLGLFLSNTFVNVYLWRQANDFVTIASYNLAIYVLQSITFIIAGKLAKKVDRIIILRLGVSFLAIFFLTVLVVGQNAASFHLLLGSLLGIGYGFYWLAFNVLTFEITEPDTRDFFNGMMGGLESLGGMIGPILAGIIINAMVTNRGYMVIFTISLTLFIMAVIMTFFIKRRKASGKYQLKKIIISLKDNQNWRYVLLANVSQGIREGLFMFVITILVFIMANNELAVGIFNLVIFSTSFIFYIIVTELVQTAKRNIFLFIGSVAISLSIFILYMNFSYLFALLYAIVIGISYPVLNVPFNSISYDVIGKSEYAKELRIEYVVTLELFVNIGRIFSVSAFIICLIIAPSFDTIKYILIIISQSYLFIFYFMKKIHLNK